MALSAASTAGSLYQPLISRDIFDGALLAGDSRRLIVLVGLFALIAVAAFAVNVVSGLLYTRVSADVLFDMRLDLYRHLQQLSPRFYARTRLGDIMSRLNNDISEIQRIAAETTLAWVGNVLFLAGTVAMLAWLDLQLFAISAVTAPFGVWALVHYRRRLEPSVAALRQSSADIGSFLVETIQGMRLVVTAGAQSSEVTRFRTLNATFVRRLLSMQLLTYVSGGLPGLLLSAGTGAVFLAGGVGVIQGRLTLGTFVAYMAYQMRLVPPMQALLGLYANLAVARVSLDRVSQLLDEPVEVREIARPTPLPHVDGRVQFDNVSLTFGRGAPVLDRVSFAVDPGQVLALVGPSGSGKSTVADLLVRLVDPDAGVVRLDGHDLRTLRLADVRRHVALVDQQPVILHTTIAENIRYARPDASDADVRAAARDAALDRFIERLPDRYDTVVGEKGAALSVGERQRMALARAFLCRPSVLVLDEPSSALDPAAERQVIESYRALMRTGTTIVITHRVEVARQADRIVALNDAAALGAGEEGLARV
jgi:ATP-binding cassette, subfamily B, bacterial